MSDDGIVAYPAFCDSPKIFTEVALDRGVFEPVISSRAVRFRSCISDTTEHKVEISIMAAESTQRDRAPVFVVGSPRSGTTLLYHTLLSSGKFVVYQAESDIFNRIAPAFGDLRLAANRGRLADAWLQSDYFRRTGLAAETIRQDILYNCKNPGDILRIVMDRMARMQGVSRWADNTPAHVLYISAIKACIPNALFIHIIRDGRDVAISMSRMGWGWGGGYRIPWDRSDGFLVSALYWQWLVKRGREQGKIIGSDYCEVRYEDLLRRPEETLAAISSFIGDELNYKQIHTNAVGSLVVPNSSFGQSRQDAKSYIGRWKTLDALTAARSNSLIGGFLKELGYTDLGAVRSDLTTFRLSVSYPFYHRVRHRIQRSALGRRLICKDRLRPGALDAVLWQAFSVPCVKEAYGVHTSTEIRQMQRDSSNQDGDQQPMTARL